MNVKASAAALSLGLLSACANVNYETTRAGTFQGDLVVVWLRDTGKAGDGTFIYVPSPRDPLTFTRPEGETRVRVIAPEMMYTDGGSIPPIGRVFNGLTPWNYGPAYMIHDWLFAARQCLNDGKTDESYRKMEEATFQDSAEIIAEAIKALEVSKKVKKRDISGPTVTYAVTSPFSLERWKVKGACNPVTADDRKLALRAIGFTPEIGDIAGFRTFTNEEGAVISEPAAEVVAIFSF
ncbi:hypothetical protein OU426_16780 [Frigidibacter sp. RF13]|uniref:DUF1353 domain-containing protein n=1 Tax=Frigidibacter sp. RF13 TaxID=2997340 RepID=UPI002271A419|nr:DUF1353 domain-containing protein [Frigidibacter sp. RF13]MCY1128520.1 hypothetical protein [Frigidibacter sp. RF13]